MSKPAAVDSTGFVRASTRSRRILDRAAYEMWKGGQREPFFYDEEAKEQHVLTIGVLLHNLRPPRRPKPPPVPEKPVRDNDSSPSPSPPPSPGTYDYFRDKMYSTKNLPPNFTYTPGELAFARTTKPQYAYPRAAPAEYNDRVRAKKSNSDWDYVYQGHVSKGAKSLRGTSVTTSSSAMSCGDNRRRSIKALLEGICQRGEMNAVRAQLRELFKDTNCTYSEMGKKGEKLEQTREIISQHFIPGVDFIDDNTLRKVIQHHLSQKRSRNAAKKAIRK
eukprot:Nk52_evm4s2355 gene=Nk52_evmTU4s2355